MSAFDAIDLSLLPAPDLVPEIGFEATLAAIKADLIVRAAPHVPQIAEVLELESELVTIVLQAVAYREVLKTAEINDSGRAVLLASASGEFLDALALNYGLMRQQIDPGLPDATPPVPPTFEADNDLRRRIQLSFERVARAGTAGYWVFETLAASGDVKDARPIRRAEGLVEVVIVSASGDGVPDQALIDVVQAHLASDEIRPLSDTVVTRAPTVVPFAIEATLRVGRGPDPNIVLQEAEAELAAALSDLRRIGRTIPLSSIYKALQRSGVTVVTLTSPVIDVEIAEDELAVLQSSTITLAEAI